jgi:hypothetical protein
MSFSASGSRSQSLVAVSSSRAPVPGDGSQVIAVAGSCQTPAQASSSQLPDLPRYPTPPPAVVRYVCTVNQSCRQTFSNYNNWAQHETSAHRMNRPQYEGDDNPRSNEANLNKRTKSHQPASAQEQADALKKSNAQQTANALQKDDALASTYDIWYCDGVDGCMDGWYTQADFEAHFKEKHTMGWNKLPRSTLHTDYLLGPEHGVRIWCGFCNMILEASNKDNWYYDRLTHIASHFDRTCPDEIWYGNIYAWCFIEMH